MVMVAGLYRTGSQEPNPAIPKSSLELNVWLISKLKELVGGRFTEDYE